MKMLLWQVAGKQYFQGHEGGISYAANTSAQHGNEAIECLRGLGHSSGFWELLFSVPG